MQLAKQRKSLYFTFKALWTSISRKKRTWYTAEVGPTLLAKTSRIENAFPLWELAFTFVTFSNTRKNKKYLLQPLQSR